MNFRRVLRAAASALAVTQFVFSAPAQSFNAAFDDFVRAKQTQCDTLAKGLGLQPPPEFGKLFEAAKRNDSNQVSSLVEHIQQSFSGAPGGGDPVLRSAAFQPLAEVAGGCDLGATWNHRFLEQFGADILASMPPGGVYFGGTDAGRFAVSVMCRSQIDADPVFVLTQNQMGDVAYLDYVRAVYGKKIHIPDQGEYDKVCQGYINDLRNRLNHDRNQPNEPRTVLEGESFSTNGGRLQVSGNVAVMAASELLVKNVFDQNPNREFYLEESYPLRWTYPNLTPSGLVLKINRNPVREISADTIAADRNYWTLCCKYLIGDWLTYDDPASDVCAVAERVYVRHDPGELGIDPAFVKDTNARKAFGKLRASIAGIYAWRAGLLEGVATPGAFLASAPDARNRMIKEADFAFRQAFMLAPENAETASRYASFLTQLGRIADAQAVAATAAAVNPGDLNLNSLDRQLQNARAKTNPGATGR